MPFFRTSGNPRARRALKNHPAFGMKYPGLVNSFSHRISNWNAIRTRANKSQPVEESSKRSGIRIIDIGNDKSVLIYDLILDNNGDIVIFGVISDINIQYDFDFVIIKLDRTTGALIEEFGEDGIVAIDISGNKFDQSISLQIDEDNNIFAAGNTFDLTNGLTNMDTAIIKLHGTTGALIDEFGENGIVIDSRVENISFHNETLVNIQLDDNGNILSLISANSEPFLIKRDKITGELINDFGTNGVIQLNYTNFIATSLRFDTSWNIFIGGYTHFTYETAPNNGFTIVKLDSNGDPSPLFGNSGIKIVDVIGNINDLQFDANGNLFARGFIYDIVTFSVINQDSTIIKLNSITGEPIFDFGTNGQIVYNSNGDKYDSVNAMKIDEDGNIISVGRCYEVDNNTQINSDVLITKVNGITGEFINDFGTNGKLILDISNNNTDFANGIDIDTDGNVYVGGYTSNPPNASRAFVIKLNSTTGELINGFENP